MAHAASAPALPASGPSMSSGLPTGHHSRNPSGSSAMSAPTGASARPAPPLSAPPGTQAVAGSSMPAAARKPQSKAELNAHILSLYSRPSSSPGVQPGMAASQQATTAPPPQPGVGVTLPTLGRSPPCHNAARGARVHGDHTFWRFPCSAACSTCSGCVCGITHQSAMLCILAPG